MSQNGRAQIVRILKERYERCTSERLAKNYRLTGQFAESALWKKTADLCIELDAEPAEFIAAAFAGCKRLGGPFANMLQGDAARKWWHDYIAAREEEVDPDEVGNRLYAFEWRLTIIADHLHDRLKQGETEFDARHAILKYPLFKFPPYVRVVLSYPVYPDIVEDYLAEAQEYFKKHPTAATACEAKFPLLAEIMALPPDPST